MREEELRRLEDLLRRDKAMISEECEAAAVRDFAHVAQEYFDLDGRVEFSLREEKGRRRAFSALVRLGYDPGEIRGEMEGLRAEFSDEEQEEQASSLKPVQLPPLRQLLEKKYGSVLHDPKGQARAIRGLMRRGYPYGEIRREIEALQQERETEE